MRRFFILLFILAALPCYGADDTAFDPWDYNNGNKYAEYEESPTDFSSRFLIGCVKIYQEYISPVRGGYCPMYPSCSEYSIQAIKKHGFFIGIMMTADRLIHENNEMDSAPVVKRGDEMRFYDPVENNDFWWYKK